MNYDYAQATLKTARSQDKGKPVEYATRLFARADDKIAVRYHNTDVVIFRPDGLIELYNGGWNTVTTLQKIRAWSPAHLFSVKKQWYVRLQPDPADPEPARVAPAVPAPFERPADFVAPEGINRQYFYRERYHIEDKQSAYDKLMERFGSVEQWREERKRQYSARKAYIKARREWEKRNNADFYDGIIIDDIGYALRKPLNGPSEKAMRKYKREVETINNRIDKYLKLVRKELQKGLPMPSGGDCWYCALSKGDGVPLGDAMDTLYPDGSVRVQPNHTHLFTHMVDRYVVPSLLVNALREKGYRDVGIYVWLNMDPVRNDPDGRVVGTDTMGGNKDDDYDTVIRALKDYMQKRLISKPPTK